MLCSGKGAKGKTNKQINNTPCRKRRFNWICTYNRVLDDGNGHGKPRASFAVVAAPFFKGKPHCRLRKGQSQHTSSAHLRRGRRAGTGETWLPRIEVLHRHPIDRFGSTNRFGVLACLKFWDILVTMEASGVQCVMVNGCSK